MSYDILNYYTFLNTQLCYISSSHPYFIIFKDLRLLASSLKNLHKMQYATKVPEITAFNEVISVLISYYLYTIDVYTIYIRFEPEHNVMIIKKSGKTIFLFKKIEIILFLVVAAY